jgi:hypothetical protein
MTRETKIGLVVAGSFLCLVAVVVVSKWRNGTTPPMDPEEQMPPKVAAAKPTQNPPDQKKDTAAKKEIPASGTFPALPPQVPNLDPQATTPLTLPPSLIGVGEPRKDAPVLVPAPPMSDFPKPPTLPGLPDGQPSFPIDNKSGSTVVTPPLLPLPPAVAQEPQPGTGRTGPPAVVTFPPPPPVNDPLNQGAVGKIDFPPPSVGAFGTTSPFADAPKPFVGPVREDTPIIQPPAKGTNTPAITLTFPNDPPTLPTTPTIPSFPEAGRNPQSVTPPIVIGAGNPPMPKVTDVSVDLDVCRPNETNFAIVALRFYGADKYGDALLEYNRRHASQVRNGSAFTLNPRALQEGQQVLRPPVGILERDHASLIPGLRPAVPAIPSAVPAVKVGTPSPMTPPSGVAIVSNPPIVGGGRTYRVQSPNGESILDIAERQLGDRGRWNEIYRLNPNYQPQFRIPAGTELQMPAPAARPGGGAF